jgi:hypothetical protein
VAEALILDSEAVNALAHARERAVLASAHAVDAFVVATALDFDAAEIATGDPGIFDGYRASQASEGLRAVGLRLTRDGDPSRQWHTPTRHRAPTRPCCRTGSRR